LLESLNVEEFLEDLLSGETEDLWLFLDSTGEQAVIVLIPAIIMIKLIVLMGADLPK
jgi:hypothetical protein